VLGFLDEADRGLGVGIIQVVAGLLVVDWSQ
jgi:hypothetical protein